ncbi:unnamed protein product [Camellia sinensis]
MFHTYIYRERVRGGGGQREMVCGNTFAKTICSICYEDLKPIVEDLQSISICGHVFHELCIQQWFEYCSNGKKKNCPVCKQTCSEANVGRLYFQSVGDSNGSSLSQKPINCEEDPEELRREIEKLEGKISGLGSALERHQKDIKELSKQVCFSKEQAKKEAELKNEALRQKASIQQSLHFKSEQLDRSTLECTKLQERNMALAKELATLKLSFDLDLTQEEALKLASLGNEANTKGTIDILNKTLAIRKKSYIELMEKCKDLGKEARSLRKSEKAKEEKIKELKTRIQELETSAEVRDNDVLRALKTSKKTTHEGNILNDVHWNSNSSSIKKCFDYQMDKPTEQKNNLDQNGNMMGDLFCPRKIEKFKPSKDMGITNTKDERRSTALDKGSYFLIDENESEMSTVMHEFSQPNCLSRREAVLDTKADAVVHGPCNKDAVSGSRSDGKVDMTKTSSAAMDEDVLLLDDIKQVQSFLHIEKETPCPVLIPQAGNICFSGGLLGPDGTTRHLGKWCKRTQGKGSAVTSSGTLISVGADGRGGKIKVLRSLNQSSLDGRETSTLAKRCKYGAKTSSLQSRGCLQMEHFFGKAGQ